MAILDMPLDDIPDSSVPKEVRKALDQLLRATHEAGPPCVGAVIVFVFENTDRVMVLRMSGYAHADGEDPNLEMLLEAADAIDDHVARLDAIAAATATAPKGVD